jgi:predicted ATPase
MTEGISLGKELDDMHGLAQALFFAGLLAHFVRHPGEVERLTSDFTELSMRQGFAFFLAGGEVLRGWACRACGDIAAAIASIEQGIKSWVVSGATLLVPYYLALKAEVLHLADRSSEALDAISEAEALVERSGERWWSAELHRLRGVFLAATGADEVQIEASFRAAIITAKDQKSISLATRAEASYAEYRARKEERGI